MTDGSQTLLKIANRIRALEGRALVVKLGGSAMEVPAATRGMLDAVAALQTLGVKLILVHGGGKPIDRAMDAAGLKPLKIQGRRYTDDATLEIVVKVLREINASLVDRLAERGISAVGILCGITGVRLLLPGLDLQPVDLGRVGTVVKVDRQRFHDHFQEGTLPVVPSLALDEIDGGWLNVNADSMVAGLAQEIECESVLFLTDTPGVLMDRDDTGSRRSRLTMDECRDLIGSGVIDGGMIPKVEACFEALDAGADRAVILDGRDTHSLLDDFLLPGSTGTEIVK